MPDTKAEASTTVTTCDPKGYAPPRGVQRELAFEPGGRTRGKPALVQAEADWLVIREHGVPVAEVFFTAYTRPARTPDERRDRPVTFLFNGGPGAASAFLHLGTAGPLRIDFDTEGRTLPPPARLVNNTESWLDFTDLVFVDPVGTGFSRTVHESRLEQNALESPDEQRDKRTKDLPEARKGFFKINRDIDVLTQFVSQYLSRAGRWESPVHIAGESYGGFRVGKLLRALPERGVGLSGAVMVSPAIDFMAINGSDYDVLAWISVVPTMALSARYHGRLARRYAAMSSDQLAAAAENFAIRELAPLLLLGDRAGSKERERVLGGLADLIGLPMELVRRSNGRVRIDLFARELLREQGLVCGLYDAAITGPNVFPDRESGMSPGTPDPTLAGITAAFTSGVNAVLRDRLGLSTAREYLLINDDVWKHWTDDRAAGYWDRQLECADDMRIGLAMNPQINLLVTHGRYDLVTTYFSTAQSIATLRLPPDLRERVRLAVYDGGHMFYTWERSRKAVQRDVAANTTGN